MSPERRQEDNPLNTMMLLRDYVLIRDFEKEIKEMNDDLAHLREEVKEMREKDLKELQDAIIGKQQQSYKRIIAVQSAILSPVAIAVVIYIIQRFL